MSEELPILAAALGSQTGSAGVVLLGRLLDSLPVPVLLMDCGSDMRVLYANPAWPRPAESAHFLSEGRPLGEVLAGGQERLLPLLQGVCATGEPAHHRDFDVADGEAPTRWDWEAYPILDAAKKSRYIVVIAMDVTDRPEHDPDQRQKVADSREKASGILRIFGVAPDDRVVGQVEQLTSRERAVADLVALGLSNSTIASRLFVSRSTVASHVASILHKLDFGSRVQIAAWVVARRLREESAEERY
jgi:DNA-binding CsgD family transcriptional regulator